MLIKRATNPHSLKISHILVLASSPGTVTPKARRRVKFDLRMKSFSIDNPEYNPEKEEHEEQGAVVSQSLDDIILLNRIKPKVDLRQQLLSKTKKRSNTLATEKFERKQGKVLTDDETYVVLYGYIASDPDDIDLTLGSTVKVVDSSDPDWWKGTVDDGIKIGYFPSNCVAKIMPGYKLVRVCQ
ncbi:unnamed protein product, partial [Didymodactylos carnosus]